MSVTPSTTISTSTQAGVSELWALAYLFRANWSNEVKTSTAWNTDVATAKSVAEQRRGLTGRPSRRSSATLFGLTLSQTASLTSFLQRSAQSRSLFPLFSDQSRATAASSGSTINCPTDYRRVSVGSRVVIMSEASGAFDVRTVISKTSSTITVDSPLSTTFPIDSLVLPLLESRVLLSSAGLIITDRLGSAKVEGYELPGPWCADPSAAPNSTPAGFSSYLGHPILDIPLNYTSPLGFEINREGAHTGTGISQAVEVFGSRARVSLELPFLFTSRAEWWKLNTLLDSRCGRTFPFWVPSPTEDYEVDSYTVSGLKVKANGPELDWQYRPYIYLAKLDGTVQVRTVVSHLRSGGLDTLVLDTPFTSPTSGSPVSRVGICYLARLDSDEIEESWITDETCEVTLKVVELLEEKSVTITNAGGDTDLEDLDTDGSTTPFDPEGGVSPSTPSGVVAPMFFFPGGLPSERPMGAAANYRTPQGLKVRIRDSFAVDSSFPISSGSVSLQLLEALPGTYDLSYVGAVAGTQRGWHWHHLQVAADLSLNPVFTHHFDSNTVTRHLWRATKTYLNAGGGSQTISVDLLIEWDSSGLLKGAAGALFNFYVYSNEVNSSYVDGTPFAPRGGRIFSKGNPAHYVASAPWKVGHPQMLLASSTPTTWENPLLEQGARVCTDSERAVGTPPDAVVNGAPWLGNDPEVCFNNVVFGPNLGSFVFRAASLGGDCPTSTLFEHLIVENAAGLGITALKPLASGMNAVTGQFELGNATMEVICTDPDQSSEEISCCEDAFADGLGSAKCWTSNDGSCCFHHKSYLTLRVVQKGLCEYKLYANNDAGADCQIPIDAPCVSDDFCCSSSREFRLDVCSISFMDDGSQSLRKMVWDCWWKFQETGDPASDYVRVWVSYDDAGWHIEVPPEAMPLYPQETFCPDEGTDCTYPNCCTVVLKTLEPASISRSTGGGYLTNLGAGKPWENYGGPGCNRTCVGCPPEPGDVCAAFEDFQCAILTVHSDTSECSCVACETGTCLGAEVWHGSCGSISG